MAVSECSSQKKAMSIDSKRVPTCWGNAQTPFAFPFLRVSNSISVSPTLNLSELGSSFASAADKFLRTIHLLASQNPILNKFLSLSSQFHGLRAQIRCSQFRKVSYLSTHNFAAVLPGDSVAGLLVANGIINFLNIYNTLLIVRLVLTWFPNSPPAIVSPLSTICDPYLNIFRGLIPPLGGTLDLSPILAFLVLNAFTSTAAALPAELPVTDNSQQGLVPSSQLTTSQRKWMRRLQGNKSRDSRGFN